MIIDKYDMNIYPRKLWVATGWGKEITSKFKYRDGCELDDCTKTCDAVTYDVQNKISKSYGILIVFFDSERMGGSKLVGNISHECVHAMTGVFMATGIKPDADNDEPMAYLVGWAAECCWKTLQKAIYNDKTKAKKK